MVARRMRRNTQLGLFFIQPEDCIGGPAHFERARLLEILTLKEKLHARQAIEMIRRHHRRSADMRFDPLMRRNHVVVCRDVHRVRCVLHHAAAGMAMLLSVGQGQGSCDPTNTANGWIANHQGVDGNAIMARTLPFVWGSVFLGLGLAAAWYL